MKTWVPKWLVKGTTSLCISATPSVPAQEPDATHLPNEGTRRCRHEQHDPFGCPEVKRQPGHPCGVTVLDDQECHSHCDQGTEEDARVERTPLVTSLTPYRRRARNIPRRCRNAA